MTSMPSAVGALIRSVTAAGGVPFQYSDTFLFSGSTTTPEMPSATPLMRMSLTTWSILSWSFQMEPVILMSVGFLVSSLASAGGDDDKRRTAAQVSTDACIERDFMN